MQVDEHYWSSVMHCKEPDRDNKYGWVFILMSQCRCYFNLLNFIAVFDRQRHFYCNFRLEPKYEITVCVKTTFETLSSETQLNWNENELMLQAVGSIYRNTHTHVSFVSDFAFFTDSFV